MASLTKPRVIEKKLKEGYDPNYYSSLYRQMNYAFGEPWNSNQVTTGGDGYFPYFPDINSQYQQIGRSRRILNASFAGMARVMGTAPEPEFPNLDEMTGEARKGWFEARYNGDGYGSGNWSDEEQRVWMDGSGLGTGFMQLGLTTGRHGYQLVSARHSPTLFTLGDGLERSPDRWRWIAFVHYMAADEAKAVWGADVVQNYVRTLFESASGEPTEVVRIIEYYDLGIAGSVPTRAIIPHDITEKPLVREENPFGCLPFAHYTHFYAPGMRRPIGRIVMQMATQEAINEVEEQMRSIMRTGKPFDIMNPDQYEPADIKALKTGRSDVRFVRRKAPKTSAADNWERIPATEVSQSTILHLNNLERQYNSDSGETEYDRSNLPAGKRTAREVQELSARSDTQKAWGITQSIRFRKLLVHKAVKMGAMFDREPVFINFKDVQILLNDPQVPESSAENFLSQESECIISEESMTLGDELSKRRQKLAELQVIAPYVGQTIDPMWFTTKLLKAIGEKDIRSALMQMQSPGQGMAPMPGQTPLMQP